MNKKYYYNLKLTEEEFELLIMMFINTDTDEFTSLGHLMYTKILTKLVETQKKVNKLKEDNKCQNHK